MLLWLWHMLCKSQVTVSLVVNKGLWFIRLIPVKVSRMFFLSDTALGLCLTQGVCHFHGNQVPFEPFSKRVFTKIY